MAIVSLIAALTKALSEEKWQSLDMLNALSTKDLHQIFLDTIVHAEQTEISHIPFLQTLGIKENSILAKDLWIKLYHDLENEIEEEHKSTLDYIFNKGTLASRMLNFTGENPDQDHFHRLAQRLIDCLNTNSLF